MTLRSVAKNLLPEATRRWLRESIPGILDGIRSLGKKTCTRQYLNFTLVYNRGNTLVQRLRSEPIFEQKLGESMVSDLSRQSGLFLDIGSNLGLMSLFVLSKLPNQKIVAFEPGPTQRHLLEETVARNKIGEQITLESCAVGDKSGTQTFFVHHGADVAKDGLADTGRSNIAEKIEVKVETLDNWWIKAGKPKISVIKIDTEGAEKLVFDGAREMIAEVKPIIYFELEASNLRAYPYKAQDVITVLESFNYKVSTLSGEVVAVDTVETAMRSADTFRATAA